MPNSSPGPHIPGKDDEDCFSVLAVGFTSSPEPTSPISPSSLASRNAFERSPVVHQRPVRSDMTEKEDEADCSSVLVFGFESSPETSSRITWRLPLPEKVRRSTLLGSVIHQIVRATGYRLLLRFRAMPVLRYMFTIRCSAYKR